MDCVISCEHASNHIPRRWQKYFHRCKGLLKTHAGYDLGAAYMARCLARQLDTTPHLGQVSRLLVDLNRSQHHPQLFSPMIKRLDRETRESILTQYYQQYRRAVIDTLDRSRGGAGVAHFSVHSFTPKWRGETRGTDIGLLYDPGRAREVLLCRRIKTYLRDAAPALRVRRNYPYRGVADGFTTALRKRYPDRVYAGIELEFSQTLTALPDSQRRALCEMVADAIRYSMAGSTPG